MKKEPYIEHPVRVAEIVKLERGKKTERQSKISAKAKTIKLADVIDNIPDIAKHDSGFAKRYIPEMQALVEALKGGDPILWSCANEIIFKETEVLK